MFDHQTIPLHWVNRLGFLTRRELSAAFRKAGHTITPEEWAILLVLWQKGPQTPGALADVTIKDRTTVTRLIDTMLRKELVSRTEDSQDRRRSVVAVCARGLALKGELVALAETLIARAQAGIPAQDLETTTRTLRAMTENLLASPESATTQKDAR